MLPAVGVMSVYRTDEFGIQRMGDVTYASIANLYRAYSATDGRSELVADLV